MRFDLKDEAITEYLRDIENYSVELQNNNIDLQKQLNEVLSQTQYELLQKLIDEIVRNYNESVVDASKGILGQWCESENSLKAIMYQYRVGEQAEKTCSDLDKRVIEKISQNLNMISLEYESPKRPQISKEDFERVEQLFQQYEKKSEETYSVFRSKIRELAKENEIYLCVPALVSLLQKKNVDFVEFAQRRIGKLASHIEKEMKGFTVQKKGTDGENRKELLANENKKILPNINSYQLKVEDDENLASQKIVEKEIGIGINEDNDIGLLSKIGNDSYREELISEIDDSLSDDLNEDVNDVEKARIKELLIASFVQFEKNLKKKQREEDVLNGMETSNIGSEKPSDFAETSNDIIYSSEEELIEAYKEFSADFTSAEKETTKFFNNPSVKLAEKCCTKIFGKLICGNTDNDTIRPMIIKSVVAFVIDKVNNGKKKKLHRANDMIEGYSNVVKYLVGSIMKEVFRFGSNIKGKHKEIMADYFREKLFIEKGFEEESWCVKDGVNCFYAPVHYVINKMKEEYEKFDQKDIEQFEKAYFCADSFIEKKEKEMIKKDLELSEKKKQISEADGIREKRRKANEYYELERSKKYNLTKRTDLTLGCIRRILEENIGADKALDITKILSKYYEENYDYSPNEEILR